MIIANFDGVPNLNSVYPPDTDGDVGPDHYFQMINLSFQIFDKEGNSLYGPADNQTLWNGFIGPWTGTNDGDPVILYDEEADSWVATQFAINTQDGTYWELIAVSETGDPLGAYYRYAFQFPVFNDYPKMGVWPDGYYFSFNMFGPDYRRAAVCSLERDAMLAGDPEARMILFDLPQGSEPWSLLPADFDGPQPPAGTPNYFIYAMDDAYGSGDYLSLYAFVSDWDNPENSTFSEDYPPGYRTVQFILLLWIAGGLPSATGWRTAAGSPFRQAHVPPAVPEFRRSPGHGDQPYGQCRRAGPCRRPLV